MTRRIQVAEFARIREPLAHRPNSGEFGYGRLRFGLVLAALLLAAPAHAADDADYVKHIKPVLHERCYACHGALKQEGGLRLDTAAAAIKGGETGPAIKPGDAASAILARVTAADLEERMPPEGEPLTPAQIAALRQWISQGAKAPADEQPERDPLTHWAFRTPVRPAVPVPANAAWAKNPIDAFVAAGHAKRGLVPQGPADKRVWLRRVSLDLVGLPPTREEQEAFLADSSPEAYDKVVTRLLDSPQYGERWGRHWMDIWRYSDWWGLGAEVRNSQKHMWHWRDWIIESLNADKGYDQMLREMLAADELYPNDLDKLRGSGFLARQYFKFNRTSWLDEAVEHTSKAMLGLTFNCCKCHDHKYDPLSQVAYYQMRAIFEPYQVRTELLPGELDFEKNGLPRAFDCNLEAVTHLHIRGDDRNPDKARTITPNVPAFFASGGLAIKPVELPLEAWQPGLRPHVAQAHLKQADARIAEARSALDAARKKLAEAEKAAQVAVAKPPEAAPQTPDKAGPQVRDTFAAANPEVWETREGTWTYAEGKLVQSQVGASRAVLRLKQLPPADFEARLKYTPTGGEKWQSVGISFDVTDKNEVLAYLSCVAGGSKSQVAYKQGANYLYPPEGAEARAVDLNKPHELVLRVKGSLVNVSVDGQPSLAYRLPIARQRGHLEVITFDAKAEFSLFELTELAEGIALTEARPSPEKKPEAPPAVPPVDQAKLAVEIAERALRTAEAQPASIRARAEANVARIQNAENLAALVAAAVRAERTAAIAKADEEVARAELEVLKAAADKKAAAEKKLADSKAALETARKALDTPGETYAPFVGALKTLENNLESEDSRRKPFPKTSTGRRAALARWMTDTKNPLPARVAVNHLWARHFGRGIVTSVFDFGLKGAQPTQPELLDWLAVEFVEHGWSMKHVHRLIVTSNTYKMTCSSAGAAPGNLTADPDNRYLWRRDPVRMEAQVVRDSLLHLAGELDLTLGGPTVPVSDESSKRRSLYYFHSHNEHQKFLSMFDDANVLECYRRAESVVPQQALALENSPLATAMSEKIAARIAAGKPELSDRDFVRQAFLAVLATDPTEAEQTAVLEALASFTEAAKQKKRPNPAAQARVNLVHALLNHNDFVTVR